ncbi:unnamed protein product [Moneuplotes crassus]|uniref:Uncharacterized protein n=1 Tax=Euplotes crassus TaxID=5936 RepID=A0AAD1XPS5_EUPCR|nr:unnamed protein product [Moneuplotes crassus]
MELWLIVSWILSITLSLNSKIILMHLDFNGSISFLIRSPCILGSPIFCTNLSNIVSKN